MRQHQQGDEVFTGDQTGSTNITSLITWLEETKRPIVSAGFSVPNTLTLLETHEWDSDREARVDSLFSHIAKLRKIPPLIIASIAVPFPPTPDGTGFLIDGWHRLALLWKARQMMGLDTPNIIFPCWWVSAAELQPFKFDAGKYVNVDRDVYHRCVGQT